MTWKLKFSICIVLSLGILSVYSPRIIPAAILTEISASIATIVRLKYLIALTDEADVLCKISLRTLLIVMPHANPASRDLHYPNVDDHRSWNRYGSRIDRHIASTDQEDEHYRAWKQRPIYEGVEL